jgi:hypothetical protein
LKSPRKIDEIVVRELSQNLSRNLSAIFTKFWRDVKKLAIVACKVKEEQLVEWLNTLPELEELYLTGVIVFEANEQPILELNLHKLKWLDVYECDFGENTNILNAIPTGVIEELHWFSCPQIPSFLRNQLNLKRLFNGDGSSAMAEDFDFLSLKELSICNMSVCGPDSFYSDVFLQQHNLTVLTLPHVYVGFNILNICRMVQLKSLTFSTSGMSRMYLFGLERLVHLKSLVIYQGHEEKKGFLDVIKHLNLPQLEKLGLWMFPDLDGFWKGSLGRFDNIKEISYGPCMNVSFLNDMLMDFPKIESIEIRTGQGAKGIACGKVHAHKNDYSRLKKLSVRKDHEDPQTLYIMPFIELCKNLEEIYLHYPLHIESLRHILSTKQKLKKLSMEITKANLLDKEIHLKIVHHIRDHGRNVHEIIFNNRLTDAEKKNFDFSFVKNRLINYFPIIEIDQFSLTIKKRGFFRGTS